MVPQTIEWAVGALRYYLLERSFTLCSDHAPLRWFHRMKDTNPRITRWYLARQPFSFEMVHRPGTQMVVADFLSRLPEQETLGRPRLPLARTGPTSWRRNRLESLTTTGWGPDRSEGESEDLDAELTTTAITEGDEDTDVLLSAQPSRPKVRGDRSLS